MQRAKADDYGSFEHTPGAETELARLGLQYTTELRLETYPSRYQHFFYTADFYIFQRARTIYKRTVACSTVIAFL